MQHLAGVRDAVTSTGRRPVAVAACVAVVVAASCSAVLRFTIDGLDMTGDLLRSSDRAVQARLEEQRDCLGESLDRLIPDGARVRVRVAPPAAHRIVEALLPRHRIVDGDPTAQGAWLVESSRAGPRTGCLRGLRVVAP